MIYPGCMMFFRRKKYRLVSVYQKKFAKKKTKYLDLLKFDDFVKSRKTPFFVIPAKAGIQSIQGLTKALDSGFHRSDDFLRVHQI